MSYSKDEKMYSVKRLIIFYTFLAVIPIVFITATPIVQRFDLPSSGARGTPKIESGVASGHNYTRLFVPLTSVIANYLPTFLKSLNASQYSQKGQNDRNIKWLPANYLTCSISHLGRWPSVDNKCQFYECAANVKNITKCMKGKFREIINRLKTIAFESKQIRVQREISLGSGNAVEYKIDSCVSLILHQCVSGYIYNKITQSCQPASTPQVFCTML
ncbi:uncharacterized protein LOC126838739 [Adelges cooleyi]|uniref:uncharacterized protein LOC126838739 n=1 Tax=Adelges cooleyi TaxID=133065 RepID=UPI00218010FB|nr:uncharacterized protein LOC126838739 [Adelges cooleyi]